MISFFSQNIILIYFLYGLAFFSMGIAVLLESGRSSELRFARALRPLAVFGLMHGIHEWGEMFEKILALTQNYKLTLDEHILRVIWLAGSFIALLIFGAWMITASSPATVPPRRWVWFIPATLTLIWIGGVPLLNPFADTPHEWLVLIDVWARYTLGIPAGMLAAFGFVQQQRAFRKQGLPHFGRDMLWAAIAFGWYGMFGQIFTQRSVLFPSTFLNTDLFISLFGVPVQLFRAAMAAVAAVFIIRSLRAFEVERARQINELKEAQMCEAQQRQQLQSDLLRQIVTAQEAERQRIARELHDETGQSLTAIGLGLRGVQSTIKSDPALAERQVIELESHAGRAIDELRRLVSDLRPSQLDDLGLVAALRWYTQEVESRTGIKVTLETQGKRTLSPEVNTVLFRIAQEALTNVVRHAKANQTTVRLCLEASLATLSICDDGQGFDLQRELAHRHHRVAWGLIGMQERATLVGGTFNAVSAVGKGTEVTVVVPVQERK
jgi:signal transduction histidine kinase